MVCDRCGKPGHIKPNCRVKIQKLEANVVHESKNSSDPIWEYCLTTEVLDQPTNVTSAVYQDDVSTGDQNSNSTTCASEFDSLQISPLDSLFFSDANSVAPDDPSVYSIALDLGFDENEVFELTFDDFTVFTSPLRLTISSSWRIWIKLPIRKIRLLMLRPSLTQK